MITSIFEQFEIIRLIPIHPFGNLDLSFTNSSLYLVIALFILNGLINNNIKNLVPGRWQSVIEILYENIVSVVKDSIGSAGFKYFPFLFSLFLLILVLNLVGIVPYTFTPTAHIIVTFGLSLSIWFACIILSLQNFRLNFFAMFMPAGAPMFLAPFLVLIELVSYAAKAITLGVRLAANLTAGHLIFAIIAGSTWKILTAGGLLTLASVFPLFILVFITVLEIAVALIQAYVFCLLTTSYLNDTIHLH